MIGFVLLFSSVASADPYDVVVQWGADGDILVPGPYLGRTVDGRLVDDLAVFRPSDNTWYVRNPHGPEVLIQPFGKYGDVPAPGDYDGDGLFDFAIYRPRGNSWQVLTHFGNVLTTTFGQLGDIPAPDDYDGDGFTDVATFRPSDWTWHVWLSSTGVVLHEQWGMTGDIRLSADLDGNPGVDFVVYRPSDNTWYVKSTDPAGPSPYGFVWGMSGLPVPGHWACWLEDTPAFFQPTSHSWTVWNVPGATGWGDPGDLPVPGDFHGSSLDDFTFWRPSDGTWHIRPTLDACIP